MNLHWKRDNVRPPSKPDDILARNIASVTNDPPSFPLYTKTRENVVLTRHSLWAHPDVTCDVSQISDKQGYKNLKLRWTDFFTNSINFNPVMSHKSYNFLLLWLTTSRQNVNLENECAPCNPKIKNKSRIRQRFQMLSNTSRTSLSFTNLKYRLKLIIVTPNCFTHTSSRILLFSASALPVYGKRSISSIDLWRDFRLIKTIKNSCLMYCSAAAATLSADTRRVPKEVNRQKTMTSSAQVCRGVGKKQREIKIQIQHKSEERSYVK